MPITNTVTVGANEVTVVLPVDTRLLVNVTLTPTNNETRQAFVTRTNTFLANLGASTTLTKKAGTAYNIEIRPIDPNVYEKYVTNAWVIDGAAFHAACLAYVQL
jgi:hypothetical protein